VTSNTRVCPRCGLTKPIEEFAKDRHAPLGRAYRCRVCDRIRHLVYEATRARPYRYHDSMRYKKKFPDRTSAHRAVQREVRAGRLVPQPCQWCGAVPAQAHHGDYAKPLEIEWLCHSCHRHAHRTPAA